MNDRAHPFPAACDSLFADIQPSDTGVLLVDLAALSRNYAALAAVSQGAECAATVKANGYGLGIEPVTRTLAAAGCRTFFVATIDEGRRLRDTLPAASIYVLDGLLPGTAAVFQAHALRPILNSRAEIDEWATHCARAGEALPAAIHLDTAMNRLGLGFEEAGTLIADPTPLDRFTISLYVSHLACGDDPEHPYNEAQREAFDTLRARLPQAPAAIANSPGVLMGSAFHYDMVRPGIALYGGRAINVRENPMAPVATVLARILQVRETTPDTTVGYGAAQRLAGRRRLATLAVGYADGYLRHLGATDGHEGGLAFIGGHTVPVVGRVSMDLTVVDVTDVPPEACVRGGWAELLGPNVLLDDMADRAGTIGYELLTRLGSRFRRIYLKAPEAAA